MRAFLAPAALMAVALTVTSSSAQSQYCAPRPIYVPQAPNMCGPGFYAYDQCGTLYGPNYCVTPPFNPFQGMIYGPKGPGGKSGQNTGSAPGAAGPPQLSGMMQLPNSPPMPGMPGSGPGMPGGGPPRPGMPGPPPVRPMAPFMGIPGRPQPPRYVNHPFARSPRDFFMLD